MAESPPKSCGAGGCNAGGASTEGDSEADPCLFYWKGWLNSLRDQECRGHKLDVTTPVYRHLPRLHHIAASERFDDAKLSCIRARRPLSRALPFTNLRNSLQELAKQKPETIPKAVWNVERRNWAKVLTLYAWLDPKRRGYIDVGEACDWLTRLWYLRECLKVNKCPRGFQLPDPSPLLYRGPAAGHMTLLDLLASALEQLSVTVISPRGVIEKDVAFWHMRTWLADQSRLHSYNQSRLWLQVLRSDNPEINPLVGIGFAPPDVRLFDFYSGVAAISAPEPEVPPVPSASDRLAQRRRLWRERAFAQATQRCAQKMSCTSCLKNAETRRSSDTPAPCRKTQTFRDAAEKALNDEVMLFQFPLLRTLKEGPRESNRDAADTMWRLELSKLI